MVALRLAGYRVVDIQGFLGHANPLTTLTVYCVPDFRQLVGIMRLPWFEEDATKPLAQGSDDTLLRCLVPPNYHTILRHHLHFPA